MTPRRKPNALLGLVLMLVAQAAEARFGNTVVQCEERYGKPEGSVKFAPPAEFVNYYNKDGLFVAATFSGGKVTTIIFSKVSGELPAYTAFSEAEIKTILEENRGGNPWGERKKISALEISDLGISGYFRNGSPVSPLSIDGKPPAARAQLWESDADGRTAVLVNGGKEFGFFTKTKRPDARATVTPQGFLLETNPEQGQRWERVILAKSELSGKEEPLAFENVFGNPEFVSLLQTNQIFAVMSDLPKNITFKKNLLGIGNGWVSEFEFDQAQPPATRPILIFKFKRGQSLVELIESKVAAPKFDAPGDLEALKLFEQRVEMKHARMKSTVDPSINPHKHIHDVLTDPNWVGVLAINCKIKVGNLPANLTWMGRFFAEQNIRWDHIGIDTRGAKRNNFGLLAYEADPVVQVTDDSSSVFLIRRFYALFANSKLSHFDAKVELERKFVVSAYTKKGLRDELKRLTERLESAEEEWLKVTASSYSLSGNYQTKDGADDYVFPLPLNLRARQLIRNQGKQKEAGN